MQDERRRHPRYKVKDNAFAIINPEPVRLVPILDIAMGGVGVYVNNEDQWLNKVSKLEIMVADCSFFLANLPFESISDFKAFPVNPYNASSYPAHKTAALYKGLGCTVYGTRQND